MEGPPPPPNRGAAPPTDRGPLNYQGRTRSIQIKKMPFSDEHILSIEILFSKCKGIFQKEWSIFVKEKKAFFSKGRALKKFATPILSAAL